MRISLSVQMLHADEKKLSQLDIETIIQEFSDLDPELDPKISTNNDWSSIIRFRFRSLEDYYTVLKFVSNPRDFILSDDFDSLLKSKIHFYKADSSISLDEDEEEM